jgi:hypothetical protein
MKSYLIFKNQIRFFRKSGKPRQVPNLKTQNPKSKSPPGRPSAVQYYKNLEIQSNIMGLIPEIGKYYSLME